MLRYSRSCGWWMLLIFAARLCAATSANAIEPWADRRLPVSEGLVGWYDASRLGEFRQAAQAAALQPGDALDRWPDASGHKRDLLQPATAARPSYFVADSFRAIRFDGKTHLRLTREGGSHPAMTIFVVAVPHANREAFTGFLGASRKGLNDYVSGFNLDMGPFATNRLLMLNIEGQGQQGARNLLVDPVDFGEVLRVCITTAPGPEETSLWVNGRPQGRRERTEDSTIRLDELVVGARLYTNGGPPEPRGFLEGDIAEVILYERMLPARERAQVEKHLAAKYGNIKQFSLPGGAIDGVPLVRVADPPPVQMFVPGFEVRQLPLDLTNINNVLYRPDGRLVALAYDGNIYLLSDSDGDGLEDKVATFWDNKGQLRAPIGLALAPSRAGQGSGVVVAAKGKCAILLDTDQDDRADTEQIIADGWTELPHGVDALGVAVDPRDGSVYFGLGVQDFTNAYGAGRKDATYSLSSERATILRVAPDFKSREIVATGIRFPVGIRFNTAGDLFCTDQEGATWLPNGNPFDELLHVEKGRHYGFPPRHRRYLPEVIDEPSVFDYGPQHQSTCGFNFNEPVNGGRPFGPAWWRSDALVAGYSRGKLYRTKLVKTPAGYVAQNQLIACLNLLAADACVSPQGSLVVAAHSGGPDWGSGPTGNGKLFKISALPDVARPVAAWAQSSREVHVAFDRPLAPEHLAGLQHGTTIEYGAYVAAGDRFESLRPGYKTVQDQLRTPRFALAVHNVQISPDRRTLILVTAPHPEGASYAITMKGLGRPAAKPAAPGFLPQSPETDLAYTLHGISAEWRSREGSATTSVWLPHLETQVSRELTAPSEEHAALWRSAATPGTLTLATILDLEDMLRPKVQPGSKLDFQLPAEQVTVTFRSRDAFRMKAGDQTLAASRADKSSDFVATTVAAKSRLPVEVTLPTGEGRPDLRVSWSTAEDHRLRAFPLRRFILPWAPATKTEQPALLATDLPELQGGNWTRGKRVFFSEQAACFKCHAVRGEGGQVGPDLSNLPHRDYASVHRDITLPSFAINPDFITHVVALKSGLTRTGPIRTVGDNLLISDEQGRITTVPKSDIEEMAASKISVMPEGLPELLGPDRMKDLLTFLLTDPPHMPDYGRGTPPEPRTRAAVAVLLQGGEPVTAVRPIKIVLVSGNKDHGPGEHDYPAWQVVWSRLLKMADGVTVTTAQDWPSADEFSSAQVLVFYQQGKWTPERARDIDAFLQRGGGLVYLHYAVDGGQDAPGFAQRIGLAWQGGRAKFRHGLIDLGFHTGASHPITRNFGRTQFYDESYWQLSGDRSKITLLATGPEDGADQPLFWTIEPSQGRVFVSILGHFSWTFDDPHFRILILRAIAWSAQQPIDRFNDLALPGARVRD